MKKNKNTFFKGNRKEQEHWRTKYKNIKNKTIKRL